MASYHEDTWKCRYSSVGGLTWSHADLQDSEDASKGDEGHLMAVALALSTCQSVSGEDLPHEPSSCRDLPAQSCTGWTCHGLMGSQISQVLRSCWEPSSCLRLAASPAPVLQCTLRSALTSEGCQCVLACGIHIFMLYTFLTAWCNAGEILKVPRAAGQVCGRTH